MDSSDRTIMVTVLFKGHTKAVLLPHTAVLESLTSVALFLHLLGQHVPSLSQTLVVGSENGCVRVRRKSKRHRGYVSLESARDVADLRRSLKVKNRVTLCIDETKNLTPTLSGSVPMLLLPKDNSDPCPPTIKDLPAILEAILRSEPVQTLINGDLAHRVQQILTETVSSLSNRTPAGLVCPFSEEQMYTESSTEPTAPPVGRTGPFSLTERDIPETALKHEGVTCDDCLEGMGTISGTRYKCLGLPNEDLCQACYTRRDSDTRGHTQKEAWLVINPLHPLKNNPEFRSAMIKVQQAFCALNLNPVPVLHEGTQVWCMECPQAHLHDSEETLTNGSVINHPTSLLLLSVPTRYALSALDVRFLLATYRNSLLVLQSLASRSDLRAPLVTAIQSWMSTPFGNLPIPPSVDVVGNPLPAPWAFAHLPSRSSLPSLGTGHPLVPSAFVTRPEGYPLDIKGVPLVYHPNITCDGCDQPVRGSRYKCIDCVDFDLCARCHAVGVPLLAHTPTHNMLELNTPVERTRLSTVLESYRTSNTPGVSAPTSALAASGDRVVTIDIDTALQLNQMADFFQAPDAWPQTLENCVKYVELMTLVGGDDEDLRKCVNRGLESPHSLFEVPHSLFEVPHSLFEVPVSLFEVPHSLFEVPHSLSESPVSLSESPVSLSELPVSSSEVPPGGAEIHFSTRDRLTVITICNGPSVIPGATFLRLGRVGAGGCVVFVGDHAIHPGREKRLVSEELLSTNDGMDVELYNHLEPGFSLTGRIHGNLVRLSLGVPSALGEVLPKEEEVATLGLPLELPPSLSSIVPEILPQEVSRAIEAGESLARRSIPNLMESSSVMVLPRLPRESPMALIVHVSPNTEATLLRSSSAGVVNSVRLVPRGGDAESVAGDFDLTAGSDPLSDSDFGDSDYELLSASDFA